MPSGGWVPSQYPDLFHFFANSLLVPFLFPRVPYPSYGTTWSVSSSCRSFMLVVCDVGNVAS